MRGQTMKKMVLAAVSAAVLALAAPGALRAADDTVKIGLEIPLSPPGDPAAGQLIRRGGELAIEYINTVMGGINGHKAELVVQDSQGRTESGVAGYRKLATEDKVIGVTGFFHSSVNIAVNEVANELGVPTIGTQTSAAEITSKHYETAFRTHAIDPIRVETFLEFIKKMGYKRISLVAETTDYGIGIVEEMDKQAEATKAGLELQKITFDHATTDLTPQLLQVKAFKPDLVINIGVGAPMDLMIDQAATIGLLPATPMLISYDAPVRPQFWKLHPKDGAGLYFIAYYSPKQKLSDIGEWFAKAYQAKYNEPPIYSSMNGFGDVMILAEAARQAKSTDPKAIVKALETGTFKTWADAVVTFPRADGPYWHNWAPPMLIIHYTKPDEDWRDAEVVLEHVGSKH
ncbi:MAG TPA: ABC transporter substrate-binding protein [Stellaceae bacterium]|nr:ABC transporter substrate-binding protein [Stellaceae bacterium]